MEWPTRSRAFDWGIRVIEFSVEPPIGDRQTPRDVI